MINKEKVANTLSRLAGEPVHVEYEDNEFFGIFQDDYKDDWNFLFKLDSSADQTQEAREKALEMIMPQLRQWCKHKKGPYNSITESIAAGYVPIFDIKANR